MMATDYTPSRLCWVIDAQNVYCQDGLPHAIFIDGAVHQDTLLIDKSSSLYAISRNKVADSQLVQGEFIPYRSLVAYLDNKTAYLLSKAIQLITWQRTHQFCGMCGTKTIHHPDHHATCPSCGHGDYPKIQPCVIVAITRSCPTTSKPQLLLAKHHRHATIYTLIAGFVEVGETLEMTIHREVLEEVGLMVDSPTYMDSQPWPYPTNLMVGFVAKYRSGEICLQMDELADARFFDVDDLPALPPVGTIARQIIDTVCQP